MPIAKSIDKLRRDKRENICEKCGKPEWRHPFGYVEVGRGRMQFTWKCRKFKKINRNTKHS